jgi:hypothetical protein
LNNPVTTAYDYQVTAILLDKGGYQTTVNYSSKFEVHRYQAALASSPSAMTPTNIKNVLSPADRWIAMNPLNRGQMHTLILPPGGYRIAVESTRQRDSLRKWYGEGAGTWLPIVIAEGETVYLTYRGDELSR